MIVANSPLAPWYGQFLDLPVAVRRAAESPKAAAAVDQRRPDGRVLPAGRTGTQTRGARGGLADPRSGRAAGDIAAIGGMIVPALVYCAFSPAIRWRSGLGDPGGDRTSPSRSASWAARLGIQLALPGSPVSIAIFDDLGAIVIIALSRQDLSMLALGIRSRAAAAAAAETAAMDDLHPPTCWIGLLMWTALLKLAASTRRSPAWCWRSVRADARS